MARNIGPKCKDCRRFGVKLCSKPAGKCAFEKRKTPPGDISPTRRRRSSEYGQQLKEKQKARAIYGILERQFRNYYRKANNMDGVTGDRLLELLESRLDNTVYRLGFAISRSHARQIVAHGHIQVNGKKVSIPSYQVKKGDEIKWKNSSKNTTLFEIIKSAENVNVVVPRWLKSDTANGSGQVVTGPNISEIDTLIDTRQIIEYYSRR
ncbi:MAG: 30S ribosomal protein S4 [Chloroflexi bacterium]|nr:30S ribosomal protein S4 [Chloroflexota bacterium]|tara:strand:+ start:291 stop:914 length:624 start_codon:yes stop_codon:yes gene_type:complete